MMTTYSTDDPIRIGLTLVPPSPVTDQISLEIRGGIRNAGPASARFDVTIIREAGGKETGLYRETVEIAAGGAHGVSLRHATLGWTGQQNIVIRVTSGARTWQTGRPLEVIASETRSTRRIGGAWLGLLHWSEEEGRHWNDCLRQFTETDWREMLRGMHRLGMNLVVVQETWRHPVWYGEHYHTMTEQNYRETYAGKAFYPSRLWPARMALPCHDPLEVILEEADRLGMQVMLGVGLYAHFDYTPGSLAWHKDVMTELWERYGTHPSLYGWYIAEELLGHLKPHEMRYWDRTDQFRSEVIQFFKELSRLRDRLAPHTVIMQAPGSHYHTEASEVWPLVARHSDILCIQGYQREPVDGVPVDENIRRMQAICDAEDTHLWMDMEVFGFEHPDKPGPRREGVFRQLDDGTQAFVYVPLVPETMDLLAQELGRFDAFEFICAYQYPGIFCAPDAAKQPGGAAAIRLFQDYEAYLNKSFMPHA